MSKNQIKIVLQEIHGFKLSTIKKTHSNSVLKYNSRNTNTTNLTHVPQVELTKLCFTVANTRKTIRKYRVVKGNHFRGKEPIPNKSAKSKQAKHKN